MLMVRSNAAGKKAKIGSRKGAKAAKGDAQEGRTRAGQAAYFRVSAMVPTPILHRYPEERLGVIIRGRSVVRLQRLLGSMRVVPGKRHSYRELRFRQQSRFRREVPA
jgi:hypothetical protein